jgi:putative ABC transport system permease protein
MSRLSGVRTRLHLLFARRASEARIDEELNFHVEMETKRLIGEGVEASEARRRALVAFGGVERHREALRAGRGLGWLTGLSLDVKLGIRMLVKYPGLTLVGGLAMAFAICIGAGTFEFMKQAFAPTLPLPGGDRIVGIVSRDLATGRTESQVLHDFETWRESLAAIEDVGAFRTLQRNLITGGTTGEPIEMAAMSASGFRVAGVAPVMGRALLAEDERPGAPLVLVVGHDVWQRRFAGDPAVVGRVVRVGMETARVVGVMPAGFAFPVAHGAWLPLRVRALDHARGEGPSVQVFGRLAPGATLDGAQAELTALGQATAAEFPDTHEHLRPQVLPYAKTWLNLSLVAPGDLDPGALAALARTALNLPVVLFLLLVCGNVALLVFARAATRENEMVVRTALGASRARVVGQLFVESLVLGCAAAVVGLVVAGYALRVVVEIVRLELLEGPLPFWFGTSLSPATLVYAGLLTVLAAAVAGVLPALKMTRALGERMRQGTAGGGGFRFGGIWTGVIVAQVAITIPFPLTVLAVRMESGAIRAVDPGFADEEYLSVRLSLDRDAVASTVSATGADAAEAVDAAFGARYRDAIQEVERRLAAEPGVRGVTFADRLPRTYHPYRLIDIDEGGAAPRHPQWPGYRVSSARVERNYFDVLDVPILAGRGFLASDVGAEPGVVIVNQTFVQNVLGGRNPIGRRVRYSGYEEGPRSFDATGDPWYEIVGVVNDLGFAYGRDPKVGGFYHPVAAGEASPGRLAVHVAGDPASLGPRLRNIAAAVDPALRLYDLMPIDRIVDAELHFYAVWFWILIGATGVALLLSLAGLYAVMSFTVAQRTREIGIRVALGASRRRILTAIFRRPLTQLTLGVVTGGALMVLIVVGGGERLRLVDLGMMLVYVTIMGAVCLLSAVVPTRRALGVEPADALRWE